MGDQQEPQKQFVAKWFDEIWNQSKREVIDEMFPENTVLHDGPTVYRGPTEFKHFYDTLRSQLSDVRVTVLETISEGDMVCARWSSTAKHSGTGKQVAVTGMSLLRFDNGRLAEAWQNWDQHGLLQQLADAAPKSFFQAAG
jgi:predicted SnoaL-like aldol condensation-catalyzing enzyme